MDKRIKTKTKKNLNENGTGGVQGQSPWSGTRFYLCIISITFSNPNK